MNDLINGLFEGTGALFLLANVYRVWKDKEVKGVSVVPIMFFTCWGFWNLYFYPANGLTYSFLGGIGVVSVNSVYIGQLLYYMRRTR